MDKKLYLTDEIFLQKLEDEIVFVSDVEDFSEPVNHLDLVTISKAFSVPLEALLFFYYN